MMDYNKLRNEFLRRSMRYASGVSSLYDQAIAEITREFALVEYNPNVVFSFDEYGKFGRVDSIMSRLESQIQQAVNIAIENEFGAAYKAHSDLLGQVLGTNVKGELERAFAPRITSGNAAKLYIRETAANNITHSTRVWNGAVLGQMETAVQEAMMEGMPSKQMAGLIKDYLNDPDSCFRRFRIKTGVDADGKSMYGRKWMKRIRNEGGSTSWIDADPRDYPVGQGVYHSSYQNALRYTRTSTNIAYRTADYERYQTEDFVIGFEIHTTNNPAHKEDICDLLAGRYPKEFKWVGWHPNCMCYQVPVLATVDEVKAQTDAIMQGGDPASVPVKGRVTDVPDNYKEWVANNQDRIQDIIDRGKQLPYFLRDNGTVSDNGTYTLKDFHPKSTIASTAISPNIPATLTAEQQTAWMENERKVAQVLGIERGEPMTFEQANEQKGNPHYVKGSGDGYTVNCQSCVVANELRRRGYDVEAWYNTKQKGNIPYELSHKTENAWIDPQTGKTPKKIYLTGKQWLDEQMQPTTDARIAKYQRRGRFSTRLLYEQLDTATKEPGRYHINWGWKGAKDGHIITLERLQNGEVRFYDPQTGKVAAWKDYRDEISSRWGIHVLRVDNLQINTDIIDGVVAKAGITKPFSKADPLKTKQVAHKGIGSAERGKLITDPSRIAQAQKSKQEMAKYTKEQAMCNVLVKHGHVVKHLDDTQRPDGSYDILIDGHRADLKKTNSAGNILRHASKAINKQNAELIVFEFEENTAAIRKRIYELKRKGYRFIYYFTGKENDLFEVL